MNVYKLLALLVLSEEENLMVTKP